MRSRRSSTRLQNDDGGVVKMSAAPSWRGSSGWPGPAASSWGGVRACSEGCGRPAGGSVRASVVPGSGLQTCGLWWLDRHGPGSLQHLQDSYARRKEVMWGDINLKNMKFTFSPFLQLFFCITEKNWGWASISKTDFILHISECFWNEWEARNYFLQAFSIFWLTPVKYLRTSSQPPCNRLRQKGANVFTRIRLRFNWRHRLHHLFYQSVLAGRLSSFNLSCYDHQFALKPILINIRSTLRWARPLTMY